jgi:hypothetical protein
VHDDHPDLAVGRVVDVVLRLRHENAPDGLPIEDRVDGAQLRHHDDARHRLGQLTRKEPACIPVIAPPRIDDVRLLLGLRREPDLHPRASSRPISSRTRRPFWTWALRGCID